MTIPPHQSEPSQEPDTPHGLGASDRRKSLGQIVGQLRRNRTALIVSAITGVVVLVAGTAAVTAAVVAPPPSTGAAAAETPTGTPAGWCGSNGCFTGSSTESQPTAAATPASPEPTPSPTPAWTPCPGDCPATDFTTDTCTASQYSDQNHDLLDAYIENKPYVDSNRLKDCPQFLPTWERAQTGFTDGTYAVPSDVKPGTYETTSYMLGGRVTNCYWERSANGQTVANNFVVGAVKVQVTVRASDDTLVVRGCGDWVRVQ